jgi:hypothetical protein
MVAKIDTMTRNSNMACPPLLLKNPQTRRKSKLKSKQPEIMPAMYPQAIPDTYHYAGTYRVYTYNNYFW